MNWEQVGLLVGVLSPLVGVPLGVITLYLRALREHQTTTMAEMVRRIETMERSINDLLRATADFEREYATKEEYASVHRTPHRMQCHCLPGAAAQAVRILARP